MEKKILYSVETIRETPVITTDLSNSSYKYKVTFFENLETFPTVIKMVDEITGESISKIQKGNAFFSMKPIISDLRNVRSIGDRKVSTGNVEYEVRENLVKETIVFSSKPLNNYLDFTVHKEGNLSFNIRSNGDILIRVVADEDNGTPLENEGLIALVKTPFLIDSSGKKIMIDKYEIIRTGKILNNVKRILAESGNDISSNSDTFIIRYIFNYDWLTSAEYPIKFDPSYVVYTSASANQAIDFDSSQNSPFRVLPNDDLLFTFQDRADPELKLIKFPQCNISKGEISTIASGTGQFMYNSYMDINHFTGTVGIFYRYYINSSTRGYRFLRSTNYGKTWTQTLDISTYRDNGGGVIALPGKKWLIVGESLNFSAGYYIGIGYSDDDGVNFSYYPNSATLLGWYPAAYYNHFNRRVYIQAHNPGTGVGDTRHYIWNPSNNSYDGSMLASTSGYSNVNRVFGGSANYSSFWRPTIDKKAYIYIRVRNNDNTYTKYYRHSWDGNTTINNMDQTISWPSYLFNFVTMPNWDYYYCNIDNDGYLKYSKNDDSGTNAITLDIDNNYDFFRVTFVQSHLWQKRYKNNLYILATAQNLITGTYEIRLYDDLLLPNSMMV